MARTRRGVPWRDGTWLAAVVSLVALILGHFTFHISLWPSSAAAAGPSPTSSASASVSPSPSPDPGGLVSVQNVYNIPQARAVAILNHQGFEQISVDRVCSNSVTAGNVREVIESGASSIATEVDLADENGPTATRVRPSTAITVKVSTGPCR